MRPLKKNLSKILVLIPIGDSSNVNNEIRSLKIN